MSVKKLIAAATLPTMVASPVVAANPAASLSLRGDSGETASNSDEAPAAGYPTAEAVQKAGMSTGMLVGGLVVVLVVVGAVALGSGHHGSSPASA